MDQVIINKDFGLFGNIDEGYRVVNQNEQSMRGRVSFKVKGQRIVFKKIENVGSVFYSRETLITFK